MSHLEARPKGRHSRAECRQGHGSFTPLIARTDLYDSGALRTPVQLKGRKVAITGAGTVIEYGLGKIGS